IYIYIYMVHIMLNSHQNSRAQGLPTWSRLRVCYWLYNFNPLKFILCIYIYIYIYINRLVMNNLYSSLTII
ncbi:hypothetical protein K7X86_00125, partial [Candidatus Sulcia muelleri]|nr:hypothetical protein [Candidatus Karelsulcia muelleri]